jgi:hypothetical protein
MTGRLLIALVVLCAAFAARADDWADGKAAFERGDYAAALDYFEAARDAGVSGAAVHYNIAVCQYELERYAAAGETFAYIASAFPRMAGLAEYNLGLVSRRLGDTTAASEHFLAAYRLSSDNETIRVLASNQLAEIEPDVRPASAWAGAFGVRAGYDDNVALRDTTNIPLGVTTESPMLDLFASIAGPFSGRPGGFRFEGSLYGVKYFDADEFDQNEISAGVLYEWRPGDWRIEAGVYGRAGWLGGDAFDRKIGVGIEGYRYLGDSSTLGLAWYYDDVSEGDDVFAGLSGKRQFVVARYRWFSSDGRRLLLRLRHEDNDRLDPGVSPTRSDVSVDYRYLPDTGWGFEAGASYRRSRFGDLVVPRTEDLASVRGALTRRFGKDWMLLVEYRYSNNDSTDPEFAYDRNTLTLGAMRTF